MKSKVGLIVAILLIIFGSLAYLIYTQSDQNTTQPEIDMAITPSPEPSLTTSTSEEISGEVQEIVGPVDFKNSILIKVGNISGSTNVYLTSETIITEPDGTSLNRSSIREGSNISVKAIPAEGGFEAQTVTVINLSTTSPSPTIRRLSPTLRQTSPTIQE